MTHKPIWSLLEVPLDQLRIHTKNPRSLSVEQQRHLDESMSKFGLIDKPVLNADFTIIGGHQRVSVLKLQGETSCFCWMPDRLLSDEEVDELNIRLNKNVGDWDWEILANQWDINDLLDWGFTEKDLGLGTSDKKPVKPKITLEFEDSDRMIEVLPLIESLANKHNLNMKIKG